MGREYKFKGVAAASASSIVVRFRYQGKQCREFIKVRPKQEALRAWARKREAIIALIALGQFDYAEWFPKSPRVKDMERAARRTQPPTIESQLRRFLTLEAHYRGATSQDDWRKDAERIIALWGELTLDALTIEHIEEYVAAHPRLTAKRIRNFLWPLRQMYAHRITQEYRIQNPFAGYTVRKRDVDRERETRRSLDPFSGEEMARILPALQAIHPMARYRAQFALWTGLRPEEQIELYWSDVDLKRASASIERARVRGTVVPTKSHAGRRTVKVLSPALEALKDMQPYSRLKGPHVFLNPHTDRPWDTDKQFREWFWRRALSACGVRYRPPHQLRHTYAHRMISAGYKVAWLREQMGHRSLKYTYDIYGGWLGEWEDDQGITERMLAHYAAELEGLR